MLSCCRLDAYVSMSLEFHKQQKTMAPPCGGSSRTKKEAQASNTHPVKNQGHSTKRRIGLTPQRRKYGRKKYIHFVPTTTPCPPRGITYRVDEDIAIRRPIQYLTKLTPQRTLCPRTCEGPLDFQKRKKKKSGYQYQPAKVFQLLFFTQEKAAMHVTVNSRRP